MNGSNDPILALDSVRTSKNSLGSVVHFDNSML
jgi:hypothetical protein